MTNYVTQAYYTPSGNMYHFTRGNGVWHATGYNARLQPTESYEAVNNSLGNMYFVSCTNWGDGPNGSSPAYTRAGNVYKVCPDMAASVNNGSLRGYTEMNGGPGYPSFLQFNQSFTYDALNRLTGVNDSGGYVRNFQYDPWGNMSVNNNTGVPLSGLTPQTSNNPINTANNRLWAGTYDAAGNQTQVGSVAVGYDAENQQIRSQDGNDPGVSYSYDSEGHRVSKAIDGGPTTVYVYDAQSRLISEYTTATGTLNPPCWICYLSYDHLGNVRMITGHDSGIVARHDYLAFGEEVFAGYAGRDARFGAYDSVTQRFTGQQADAESSLQYFYTRYFGGRLGRFTSPDPENAGADLMNPQSWNGYSYVNGNPMNATDPLRLVTTVKCPDCTVTVSGSNPSQFFGDCYIGLCSPFWNGGDGVTQYYNWVNDMRSSNANNQTASTPTITPSVSKPAKNGTPSANRPCTFSERAQLFGNGLLNIAIGSGKFSAAAGIEAGTSGIGTGLAIYGVYSAAGNFVGGLFQTVGAFSSNPRQFQQAAAVTSVAGTLSGLTALVASNGDMTAASHAARREGFVLFGFKLSMGSSLNPLSTAGNALNAAKEGGYTAGCH